MKYCGIDLHSSNSVVVIIDETDKVVVSRRCRNELCKVLSLLEPHKAELAGVVVESTYNWYWLVDGLMAAGHEVKLANTVAMKRYDGLNIAEIKTMLHTWRTCCGWAFCLLDTFIRRRNALCATWPESASSWCEHGPRCL